MFGLCCCAPSVCDWTDSPPETAYKLTVNGLQAKDELGCECDFINAVDRQLSPDLFPPHMIAMFEPYKELFCPYIATEELIWPFWTLELLQALHLKPGFPEWIHHAWYLDRFYQIGQTFAKNEQIIHLQFQPGKPLLFPKELDDSEGPVVIAEYGEFPTIPASVILGDPSQQGPGEIPDTPGIILASDIGNYALVEGRPSPTLSTDMVLCESLIRVGDNQNSAQVTFHVIGDSKGRWKSTWATGSECCNVAQAAIKIRKLAVEEPAP